MADLTSVNRSVSFHRFGNTELAKYSHRGAVEKMLASLTPEEVASVLKRTQAAIPGQGGVTQIGDVDVPSLAMPRTVNTTPPADADSGNQVDNNEANKLSGAALITALLGKIAELYTAHSLADILNRLQSFNAVTSGGAAACDELSNQLQEQAEQWENDVNALNEAQNEANELKGDVDDAEQTLNDAQNALNALKEQAENQNPVSPDLEQQIRDAETAVSDAQTKFDEVKGKYDSYVTNTLNPAIEAEKASKAALEAVENEAQNLVSSFSQQQLELIEAKRQASKNEPVSLTFLLALVAQLVEENTVEDLKAAGKLKEKLAEAAAANAEKKAKEYEEQVRKAEEMEKTMGCIGKVFGWIITAVSFAAAAFTGGASLAFAAVGLALTVGDEISQAVTGHSFIQEALQPVMSAIVQPLMEMLGDMFKDMLESMGVDTETAEMVGQIMGAIAGALTLIASAMLASNLMSKVASAISQRVGNVLAESTAQKILQKIMDSALGQVMKKLSSGLGRAAGMSEVRIGQVTNYTRMGLAVGSMANATIGAAGDIVVAQNREEAEKLRAQLLLIEALQELLNKWMENVNEIAAQRYATISEIMEKMVNAAQAHLQTGKYVANHIAA